MLQLPPTLRARCRDALAGAAATGAAAAPLPPPQRASPTFRAQAAVAQALQALRVPFTPELALDEGYSIDLAVAAPAAAPGGRRVAVEVDGPSHFVAVPSQGPPRTAADGGGPDGEGASGAAAAASTVPSGATRLKRRQLRALGWAVLPIPLHEWPRGTRRRQAFVARELARVALEGAHVGRRERV